MFNRVLNNLRVNNSFYFISCRGLHDRKLPSVTPIFEVPEGEPIGTSSELRDDSVNLRDKHYYEWEHQLHKLSETIKKSKEDKVLSRGGSENERED